jgi:hypothetical protein
MFNFCIRLYVLYLFVSPEWKLVIIIFPEIYISSGSTATDTPLSTTVLVINRC